MTHSFDIGIAEKVGVNSAIIYSNILFWSMKNKANGKHLYDDLYWTYNSVKAWKELFPYLGESAIKTALKKLEDNGFIVSGEHNTNRYDRTRWYAPLELVVLANGVDENSHTIPINKPIIKQYTLDEDKKFTFSLSKNTGYMNLSDEYKSKLFMKILLIDGGEHYERFISSLKANDKYKYKDFVLTYRNWNDLRVSNDLGGKKVIIEDREYEEVLYGKRYYAIDKQTLLSKVRGA